MDEQTLLADADQRGRAYVHGIKARRVFPEPSAIAALAAFDERLPQIGASADSTLALLDEIGSPATMASNGPRFFGFVLGASLPAAAAAERMVVAWDQCALSAEASPAAAAIEKVAGRWILEILDLPSESAVAFGTSATAGGLACLAAARRSLLARKGWNFDEDGLIGAPEIKVVVSDLAHVTVRKALRILGFGMSRLIVVPTDAHGRMEPDRLPPLDDATILILQAGEVNTGEFDPFVPLMAAAKAAGAWAHVDGAFGLWARASSAHASLTEGIDLADSWTTDGHKWLNTPYDGAMAICRDPHALAGAMNSDAVYASSSPDAQKNLTLEFSRRARGVPIWAALRTLGREGVDALVTRHCRQARRLADGLHEAGFEVLNRVLLNQVLIGLPADEDALALQKAAQESGEIWFSPTVWRGRRALRLSVSSWRTTDADIDLAVETLTRLRKGLKG